jgi:hypothetical protein
MHTQLLCMELLFESSALIVRSMARSGSTTNESKDAPPGWPCALKPLN